NLFRSHTRSLPSLVTVTNRNASPLERLDEDRTRAAGGGAPPGSARRRAPAADALGTERRCLGPGARRGGRTAPAPRAPSAATCPALARGSGARLRGRRCLAGLPDLEGARSRGRRG